MSMTALNGAAIIALNGERQRCRRVRRGRRRSARLHAAAQADGMSITTIRPSAWADQTIGDADPRGHVVIARGSVAVGKRPLRPRRDFGATSRVRR